MIHPYESSLYFYKWSYVTPVLANNYKHGIK